MNRPNAFDPRHVFTDRALNTGTDPQAEPFASEVHHRGDRDCHCERCDLAVAPGEPGFEAILAKVRQREDAATAARLAREEGESA